MSDKKGRAADTNEIPVVAEPSEELVTSDILPDDFATIEEFWNFWDTHSTADYEDALEDVTFEVDLASSKIYFPVAKDLLEKVRIHARRQGVSPETLINLWLQERLSKSA